MSLPEINADQNADSTPIFFATPQPVEVAKPYRPRWWVHWLLFAVTAASVLVVGARMQHEFDAGRPPLTLTDQDASDDALSPYPIVWAFSSLSNLALGIPFAATLLFILFCHEMGHYLYCRHYRIAATPPFFLPFPSMIGTLGAFIKIRAPIETRQQLFDIGIGGPIAGFIPAIVFTFIGLALSHPQSDFAPTIGVPLIFGVVHALLGHAWSPQALLLHPIALAAWAGMLATSLNLLPVGQLDGGHILFALFPRWHRRLSLVTIAALVLLAWSFYMGWIIWAILLSIMGTQHPYVSPWPKPSRRRYVLGGVALLMLALSLMPAPVQGVTLPQVWTEVRPTLHEWKMDAWQWVQRRAK